MLSRQVFGQVLAQYVVFIHGVAEHAVLPVGNAVEHIIFQRRFQVEKLHHIGKFFIGGHVSGKHLAHVGSAKEGPLLLNFQLQPCAVALRLDQLIAQLMHRAHVLPHQQHHQCQTAQ